MLSPCGTSVTEPGLQSRAVAANLSDSRPSSSDRAARSPFPLGVGGKGAGGLGGVLRSNQPELVSEHILFGRLLFPPSGTGVGIAAASVFITFDAGIG